ncbi:MAG: GntR family transcriptional regulator [Deltaproteobacteria bacterium]|nr:GntR family transcriptional regulator [Deltaproteobacteria bacterium]
MARKLKLTIQNPVSIREKVYTALRNDILDGVIRPGERIVEARLAEQIKTSRTPVREALHILEREGLLESIPRVGYRVKRIRWEEVEEICEIRVVNEILAAKWAIDRMTSKELKALEDNLAVSEKAVKEGDIKSFIELDAEFHEIIARAGRSARLLELCQMLRRHMLRYRIDSFVLPEVALQAIEGHRRIFECIQRKDKRGVQSAIRDHLEWSKQSIKMYAFDHSAHISHGAA